MDQGNGQNALNQQPQGPYIQKRTSALAIVSLVLGLLSLPMLFIAAVPAVICGHVALGRIRKSAGASGGEGFAIAGLVLGYIGIGLTCIVVVLAGMLLPALSMAREEARQLNCKNNLKQLGTALQQYLDGPGGHRYFPYPTQDQKFIKPGEGTVSKGSGFSGASFLAALYWSGVLTEPNIFICPSTSDDNCEGAALGKTFSGAGGPDGSAGPPGWNALFDAEGSHVSYAARAQWTMPRGMPLTDRLPADTVIASDDTQGAANHSRGFCVLYNDTHVDFVNTDKVATGDRGMVGNDAPLDLVDN